MKIIGSKAVILLHCMIYAAAYLLSRFMRRKKEYRQLWLICERPDEARDNAYQLFHFIRQKVPDTRIYYAIRSDSPDLPKISYLGNVVAFGSFRHYLLYFCAEKQISTHLWGTMPHDRVCRLLDPIFRVNAKKIFLQHGITKDFIQTATYQSAQLDLFVCGAYQEYCYVKERFGYPGEQVKYLGLARFDALAHASAKRQILLMPTFRSWLFPYVDSPSPQQQEQFQNSSYYRHYQGLLRDKRVAALLEQYDMKLVFYPHFEVQQFIHLFTAESARITIAKRCRYDVQELLKSSAVLMTDYSSVFFDFAYLRRPMLYYHFDYGQYRENHYPQGYFSYEEDGFGKVCGTSDEVVSELRRILVRQCVPERLYLERIQSFFPLHDSSNCRRNYEAIRSL